MSKSRKSFFNFFFLFLLSSAVQADSYRPLDHLWAGTRDLPDSENIWILSVGAAGTLLALTADQAVKNYFSTDRMGAAADIGNFWGTGIAESIIAVSSIVYGIETDHPHEVNAGEAHAEGLAVNGLYTFILKEAIQRPRPDGGPLSFPSGHTSTAFVTAANMMDMYGPAWGVPAIAMGVLTAVSRLDINIHWLSDDIFGAALGYAIGHAYDRHHLTLGPDHPDATHVNLLPYFDNRENYGFTAEMRF